jgi:hypothetical protein
LSKTHGGGIVKGTSKLIHAQDMKKYGEIKADLQILLALASDKEYLATSAPVRLGEEKVSRVCRELNYVSSILQSELIVTKYTKLYSYFMNFQFCM